MTHQLASSPAAVQAERCPACGQPLGPVRQTRCPLCDFDFGDNRATGPDNTPYAQARESGSSGWRAMLVWVWLAGAERLKHLALMRSSSASRRFARMNGFVLIVGLGAMIGTSFGWQQQRGSGETRESSLTQPVGHYWNCLARSGASPSTTGTFAEVALWFNPARLSFGIIAGALLAGVLFWLALRVMLVGATLAHCEPYRSEQRMTAAIHYGTAWVLPGAAGAALTMLLPLAHFGHAAGWPACPPEIAIRVVAGVLGGSAVVLWWFWLLRLGSTAPAKTRGQVVALFAFAMPVIAVGLGGLWWGILRYFLPTVFQSWRLSF